MPARMIADSDRMPVRLRPTGVRARRQRAVTSLAWLLLAGVTVWHLLLFGTWPVHFYQVAGAAALYLVIRTAIVLRGGLRRWTEYAFLFADAALVSAAVLADRAGLASDFYLAYFFVLGEGALTLDLGLVAALSGWVVVGYVLATQPPSVAAAWTVVIRLFFLLLASLGMAWAARREAAHATEVARLHERLALEEERRRLAREIHDGIGHVLAAGTQSVELIERLLSVDPPRARTLLPDLKRLLREGLDEIRVLVLGLRIAGSPTGDAVAAARQHLDALSGRADITTEVRCREAGIPLPAALEFAFRRILQEVLTNIARHARAGRVTVTLERSGDAVTCSVTDDGVGFDPEREGQRRGFGLHHMRERAGAFGGTLHISSVPSEGTTVTFSLPLHEARRGT